MLGHDTEEKKKEILSQKGTTNESKWYAVGLLMLECHMELNDAFFCVFYPNWPNVDDEVQSEHLDTP